VGFSLQKLDEPGDEVDDYLSLSNREMSDLREALVWGGERAGDGEEAHKIAAILSVNNGDRLARIVQ